jgi:hypothetical protein
MNLLHKTFVILGFKKISKNLWASCSKSNLTIQKRGRKNLPKDLVQAIDDHLNSLSNIAANRTNIMLNEYGIKEITPIK